MRPPPEGRSRGATKPSSSAQHDKKITYLHGNLLGSTHTANSGRRPQSAKRQRFMELRSRGWSIMAAAREVGVSRTAGHNWSRGYNTYRNGEVTGFVPTLERLAVREISARSLSQDERIEIADLCHAGLSIQQIAYQLGRAPSTISRELRRNATAHQGYRPFEAHRRATARRAHSHQRRIETNGELGQLVGELLGQRWSPEQISRHLRLKFPDEPGMWLCHESIYQAVYQPGSVLLRPSPLASHHRSPLRTGRDHRRAHAIVTVTIADPVVLAWVREWCDEYRACDFSRYSALFAT